MTIFTDKDAAVQDLLSDRLLLLAVGSLPEAGLSSTYLYGKLLSAEASVRRSLKVFFEPTKVIPEDAPQAEVDALEQAGTPYFQEANYDYDADFFSADRWGDIQLNQKPVIAVESVEIVYPFLNNPAFQIPVDWIRIDRKYGLLRLIPSSSMIAGQMAALRVQILSAGRMMPFAIRMRYTAGLKNAARDFPDLIDCIKKTAVLFIIEDMFLPQSGSISADGLSQSLSADVSKYQEVLDRMMFGAKGSNGGLFTDIHGIQMGVL
jgi:hypothetical protein